MSQQVVARFQFDPDRAEDFVLSGREFVEIQFEDIDGVIEYCEVFEDAIIDCTAFVNGQVISLSEQPEE